MNIKLTKPGWGGFWYHFTARRNLDGILREGIKPRGDRPANYHGAGLDSQPHLVYLTNCLLKPWHCFDYENTVVLLIKHDWILDYSLFVPDEDDPLCEGDRTIAYAGLINPDTIETVYSFELCLDEHGVHTHRVNVLAQRTDEPEYRLVFNQPPLPVAVLW